MRQKEFSVNAHEMQIANHGVELVTREPSIFGELLPLGGATVLELGCGKADMTRVVAESASSILALEVDQTQLEKNLKIGDLPNVKFSHGGAEQIPASDSEFDVVMMFKSLHHVPVDLMDRAFEEIHRVLKPGGLAYISEPVYAGAFNEILRLFHDEKLVREAAFAAVQRAIDSGRFKLSEERFFLSPMHFDDFAQFENQILKVTHTQHNLSQELYETVRSKFSEHLSDDGADFHMQIRVDLLQAV
jgi:ubiquinone/menaquinone biosynthesis C-methylase UbiE